MKVVVSVTASEKLCPRQYQSSERSVFLSCEMEVPDGTDVGTDSGVASAIHSAQLRAEAQLYAALHRDFLSQGVPQQWLRDAAIDRVGRLGMAEDINAACSIVHPQPAAR